MTPTADAKAAREGSPVQRPDIEHALLLAGAEAVAAHVVRVVHVVPGHTEVGGFQLQLADLNADSTTSG